MNEEQRIILRRDIESLESNIVNRQNEMAIKKTRIKTLESDIVTLREKVKMLSAGLEADVPEMTYVSDSVKISFIINGKTFLSYQPILTYEHLLSLLEAPIPRHLYTITCRDGHCQSIIGPDEYVELNEGMIFNIVKT